MSWIEEAKNTVKVPQVASAIGMSGRLRSLGPCPSCQASTRSRSDKRPPVGVNAKADGWECHACGSKGDAVEMACLAVLGCSSNEVQGGQWETLREWFSDQGVDTSSAAMPGSGRRTRAPVASVSNMVDGILGGASKPAKVKRVSTVTKKQPEPEKGKQAKRGGLYGWEDWLIDRCEAALWEDTTEAAMVLRYLMEVRKLSEESLRDFRIGMYVKADGSPRIVKGRPVIVIPLIDADEVPVSAKFRSVPVIGSCEHCDTLRGCKKCRDYRNCQGRPLPLFGAHRLSTDLTIPVVMVEGEFDVLAAHSYGLKVNVVTSTAGAGSFADEWLDLLEPYSSMVGFYDDDEAGDEGFKEVASKLGDYRCSRAKPPMNDIGDCLMEGVEQERIERALGRAQPMHGIGMKKASDYADAIEILINEPWRLRGVTTGWERLDDVIGGWRPGVVIITGETGQGKAQPLDESVLTPGGWVPIGSLAVGDEVIGANGPTRIVGVFPQGVRPICTVHFSDGVSVRCDEDHLWEVTTDIDVWKGKPQKVKTTMEIAATLRQPAGRLRWRVPTCAVDHDEAHLPVDPYVLGILLGDGSLTNTGVRFTSADQGVVDVVSARLPAGLEVRTSSTPSKALDCRIVAADNSRKNPMSGALTRLGVRCCAHEKRVPLAYFITSRSQRLDLLRGLFDSDGWVENGRPAFCSASEGLADDVANLIRSLGGAASRSSKIPSFRGKPGRRSYRVTSSLDDVFLLARKQSLVTPRKHPQSPRKIVRVDRSGEVECVCISVEDPRCLYLTTGYTLTHNTTFATAACLNLARNDCGVMLTSFEQEPIGTVQKLLRNEVGGDFTGVSADTRKMALESLGELPLWILDHYGHITPAKLVETMRYSKRRHGASYFLVDHLGFLIDPDAQDERRAIEAVIRALAIVAKQMQITIFLVAHPSNTGRDHKGKANEVTSRDLKGASAIRQDADDIIIVSQISGTKDTPWPRSKIKADKVRSDFGVSGGVATLAFDPGSNVYADSWEETPAGRDGLLVPRKDAPRN